MVRGSIKEKEGVGEEFFLKKLALQK